jgi:hypothetical protein
MFRFRVTFLKNFSFRENFKGNLTKISQICLLAKNSQKFSPYFYLRNFAKIVAANFPGRNFGQLARLIGTGRQSRLEKQNNEAAS